MLAHRLVAGVCTLSMSSFYCTFDHGLCRPLPLKFYLLGLPNARKYSRDPVSLIVIVCVVLSVATMQICIEMKKRMADRKENEVAQGPILYSIFSTNGSAISYGKILTDNRERNSKLETKAFIGPNLVTFVLHTLPPV